MSKVLIVLIVVFVVGIGLFVYFNKSDNRFKTQQPSPLEVNTVSKDSTPLYSKSYTDRTGAYEISYPEDYTLDTQDPVHIRLYKRNDTKRPQGEITDGVIIVFESVDLSEKKLSDWVDERIQRSTADGTSQLISDKEQIQEGQYLGFRYTLHGQGDSQNLVIQKDSNSKDALLITYSVNDPNKKGYLEEVNKILSTIKLFK